MIQRQCPECSSELVLARRPDNRHGPRIVAGPSTYWRCLLALQHLRTRVHRRTDSRKQTCQVHPHRARIGSSGLEPLAFEGLIVLLWARTQVGRIASGWTTFERSETAVRRVSARTWSRSTPDG